MRTFYYLLLLLSLFGCKQRAGSDAELKSVGAQADVHSQIVKSADFITEHVTYNKGINLIANRPMVLPRKFMEGGLVAATVHSSSFKNDRDIGVRIANEPVPITRGAAPERFLAPGIIVRHGEATMGSRRTKVVTGATFYYRNYKPQETSRFFPLNVKRKHGGKVSIPLEPGRIIDQVTVKFHGVYRIKLIENGKVQLNDENSPMFRDGIYALGFVENNGRRREISRKKFVDANETDNWHDLGGPSGDRLTLEFAYHPRHANDPDVRASNTEIEMRSITVRYQANESNVKTVEFANDDRDILEESALIIRPNTSHKFKVPGDRKIVRVDVRWGDAKPRVNNKHQVGRAHGFLNINGKRMKSVMNNVAMVETATWDMIFGMHGQARGGQHEIEIGGVRDPVRLFWVKVFYE